MIRRCAAFVIAFSVSFAAGAATPSDDLVWVWFSKCEKPRQLALEMRIDGRLIHSSRFPACFTRRGENDGQKVAFPLVSKSSRLGEAPGTSLDVNVWEAGGETDGMTLGVSFMSTERIWLNTLHFAEIDRPSTSTLARGIVVKTYPIRNAKAS